MKIAIHLNETDSFSRSWIEHCEKYDISFKMVDCYHSDIISQLSDCDALMWHFHQGNPKDILFAKQLMYSVEAAGKKVFPDFHTMWHFDDKVGQKYLLEAIDAPMVPSCVFYDRKQALDWVNEEKFPVVFKLRNGAASGNVRLVQTKSQAVRIVKKAFGRGFSQYSAWTNLKERIRKYRLDKTTLFDVAKGIIRLVYHPRYAKIAGRERGYAYFQQFIPGNDHDIRVVVIGKKAFAMKRMVRNNDFRASGSENVLYEKKNFDDATILLSFKLSEKLQSQCVAFDFIYQNGKPMVVEISYGFVSADPCDGYWDRDMTWHEGEFNACGWMVDAMLV